MVSNVSRGEACFSVRVTNVMAIIAMIVQRTVSGAGVIVLHKMEALAVHLLPQITIVSNFASDQ